MTGRDLFEKLQEMPDHWLDCEVIYYAEELDPFFDNKQTLLKRRIMDYFERDANLQEFHLAQE